ncbi:MAG: CAP domain-containing protein, partial [Deltaproteobacteria bacterium]|nr:CAP domain-containing protein [Deltaproteobacteria bacterium]
MRSILSLSFLALLMAACTTPAPMPGEGTERVSSHQSALGVPTGDFPNWTEQVIYTLTNRLRADPQVELDLSCTTCGTTEYSPRSPLSWNHKQGLAARFQATSLAKAKSGLSHDTVCQLVDNIADIYPDICDGSPSCACKGGSADCGCVDIGTTTKRFCTCDGGACPSASSRNYKFGVAYSGENAAAANSDPIFTLNQWINSSGHRSNLLSGNHSSLGVGFWAGGGCWSAFSVQVFGRSTAPKTVPGAAHYPRSGSESTKFSFYANYYDSTAGPTTTLLNIDGTCQPITLDRGDAQNGSYHLQRSLGAGCHRYYFVFRDSNNALITYPSVGSYGVGVSGAACPFYSTARPNLGQGCGTCQVASECDDSNPCTTEACNNEICAFSAVAGCCMVDLECDDQNLCTKDTCEGDHSCSKSPVTGCCNADAECDDGDVCTYDGCADHVCTHTPKQGCCNEDLECDDGDFCTEDTCTEHMCSHGAVFGCCNEDTECDDGSDCTNDSCGAHQCVATPLEGCCIADEDCLDNDVCTSERCEIATGTCVIEADAACCVDVTECDDQD